MKLEHRRTLAALLAVMMLLAMLSMPALADEPAPEGGPDTAGEETLPDADETPDPEATAEPAPDGEETPAPDTEPVPDPEPTAVQRVQGMIDALPEGQTVTADTRDEVAAQLAAIDEAKLALSDDEQAALDVTRYEAVAAALLTLDGQAGADEPVPIDLINGFEWTFDGRNTVTLTGEGELNLSGQRFPFGTTSIVVNGATSIAEGCFKDMTEIQSITLSDSVTTIGKSAFEGCTALVSVELPSGLTTIGEQAFYRCTQLALTSLPSGLTTIEEDAFGYCHSLTLTELPASLTSIGDHAFDSCESLALTGIPEGVTSIGNFAFLNCDGLTHLTLPASLTSMGYYVFQSCSNLTSVTFLGINAPSIDLNPFYDTQALQEILVPEGATGYESTSLPQDKIKVGHTVTVNSGSNGSASAAPTYAGEGDTIVLTATPDGGYHLKEWQTEPEAEVTDNSFPMPDNDITVTPVFEPHAFGSNWETSTGKHWHECVCGEKQDEGEHTYTDGVCSVCGYSYECDIFVKVLSGGHINPHVKSTDTVRSVKEKIKANEGIPISVQVLQLPTSRVELEDDQYLGDCGIQKDSTLHLILRYAPEGDGTADSPYLIPDAEQLEAFRYYINDMYEGSQGGADKTFQLTADVDLESAPWTPVGADGKPFAGTFDGGGHTISGLFVNRASDNQGFFGVIDGGTVKNLTVNGSVTGGENAGGIAGNLVNGTVSGCGNGCAVTGECNVGGIVGRTGDSSTTSRIDNCSNTGSITSIRTSASKDDPAVGGIVGLAGIQGHLDVSQCTNDGNVQGGYFTGGIVGNLNTATGQVEGCVNNGAIGNYNGSYCYYAGGIAGFSIRSIQNCRNTGALHLAAISVGGISGCGGSISHCSNSGDISVSASTRASNVGGIVGYSGAVQGCWNTGAVSCVGNAGGIMGDCSSYSSVDGCYNTGAVSGTQNAGGVVGQSDNSSSNSVPIVKNSYNLGAVTSGGNAGGVVGTNGAYGICQVENCYNAGTVAGAGNTGGVVGSNSSTVTNCYYLETTAENGIGNEPDSASAAAKAASAFSSGEVARLLQNGQADPGSLTWGQKLGGEGSDAFPTLTGEGAERVCQIRFEAERVPGYEARLYVNPGSAVGAVPEMPRVEGYAPVKWSLTKDADGAAFTASTPVNGDMTVYAIYEEYGSLTVSVSAVGEGADPEREWKFRIEVDDPDYEGSDGLSFTDGAAEFTLKAGQSLTLTNMPPRMRYTVTELNGNTDGYTTTVTGGEGTIVSGQAASAAFVNDRTAPAAPSDAPASVPDTGDDSQMLWWAALLLLSLAGLAAVAGRSGRRAGK